jgi:predicted enzyme related to lactoylglutathione lyase
MANSFCHIELHTSDVDKAKGFYGGLLDWKLEDMPMGDTSYTMVSSGDETIGGMMTKPCDDAPTAWMPYILVEDVDGSTAKAVELGGSVVKEKTEIPGMGSFSIVADPTGAVVGLWQAKGDD